MTSALSFCGSQDSLTDPHGTTGRVDGFLLAGGDAELVADAAPFLGGFGWASGARVHGVHLTVGTKSRLDGLRR